MRSLTAMGKKSAEERTEELHLEQLKRETEELDKLKDAELPQEARQAERRASKSAYLREKLEERARSERETGQSGHDEPNSTEE
jgi:hypothetical protein